MKYNKRNFTETERIYLDVLEGKITDFPIDFWKGEDADLKAGECTRYLITDILEWDKEDILNRVGRYIFKAYRLSGMLKEIYSNSPGKAILMAYGANYFQHIHIPEIQKIDTRYYIKERSLDTAISRLHNLFQGLNDQQIIDLYTVKFIIDMDFHYVLGKFKLTKLQLLDIAFPNRFHEWDFPGYDWSKLENRRRAVLHLLRKRHVPYLSTSEILCTRLYPLVDYMKKSVLNFYSEIYDRDIAKTFSMYIMQIQAEINQNNRPVDIVCSEFHIDSKQYHDFVCEGKRPNTIQMIKFLYRNGAFYHALEL